MKLSEMIARVRELGPTSTFWREAGFQSYQQCRRADYTVRHGIPWLIQEMDKGLPVARAERIARYAPEQQYEILKGNMKLPSGRAVSYKPEWTMPSSWLKPSTFTDKVLAMSEDIKNGHLLNDCCARYGVGRDMYQRGRNVLKRNNKSMTDAVNDGVISAGETDRLMDLPDAELDALMERKRVEKMAKKEDPRSDRGNFNVDSMRSLLHRTYVEWRGVSFNVHISAKILPGTEKGLEDMYRDLANTRNAVNMVLDKLHKEIERCMSKREKQEEELCLAKTVG